MALAIGFTNKYYTLWSVSSEEVWATAPNGQHYKSGYRVNYCYHQNLSTDKDKAVRKAKEMGCRDLVPDSDLYGRNNSWSNFIPNDEPVPDFEPYQFRIGKYKGEDIRKSDDIDYLRWYECDQDCVESRRRICELDTDYFMEGERMFHKSKLIVRRIYSGKVRLLAKSNFSAYREGNEAYVKVNIADPKTEEEEDFNLNNIWGYRVTLDFNKVNEVLDLQRRYYGGHTYYVPNGTRSFKGEVFTVNKGSVIKDK